MRNRLVLDAALAAEVCRKVSAGPPLLRVCAQPGMPSEQTIYKWCRDDVSFGETLRRARAAGMRQGDRLSLAGPTDSGDSVEPAAE